MATCVCPSDLKHRVTIEQEALVRDVVGGNVATWSTLATVWAKVAPTSASERFWRQQTAAQASHKVTIRFRTDVTTKMRLLYNGKTFLIRGVTDIDEARRWLEIACDEVSAA